MNASGKQRQSREALHCCNSAQLKELWAWVSTQQRRDLMFLPGITALLCPLWAQHWLKLVNYNGNWPQHPKVLPTTCEIQYLVWDRYTQKHCRDKLMLPESWLFCEIILWDSDCLADNCVWKGILSYLFCFFPWVGWKLECIQFPK